MEKKLIKYKEGNLIHLTDEELDTPIYRIYALENFKKLLASGRDALVSPRKWEDPFENFFLERTTAFDPASQTDVSLANLADDWYGQCWSRHAESDAMWRIYSPVAGKAPGVKVKTTIRRLFDNLNMAPSRVAYLNFFVGKVDYYSEQKLASLMQSVSFSAIAIGGQGTGFADLLCVKRDTFIHENEVRLLFHDFDNAKQGTNGLFFYPLNANLIFDEAILDPRLNAVDCATQEADLVNSGCTLKISQSTLYQVPAFKISF